MRVLHGYLRLRSPDRLLKRVFLQLLTSSQLSEESCWRPSTHYQPATVALLARRTNHKTHWFPYLSPIHSASWKGQRVCRWGTFPRAVVWDFILSFGWWSIFSGSSVLDINARFDLELRKYMFLLMLVNLFRTFLCSLSATGTRSRDECKTTTRGGRCRTEQRGEPCYSRTQLNNRSLLGSQQEK